MNWKQGKFRFQCWNLMTMLNGGKLHWRLQEDDGQLLLLYWRRRTWKFGTQKKLCSMYSGEDRPRTCLDLTRQWTKPWAKRTTNNQTSRELEIWSDGTSNFVHTMPIQNPWWSGFSRSVMYQKRRGKPVTTCTAVDGLNHWKEESVGS